MKLFLTFAALSFFAVSAHANNQKPLYLEGTKFRGGTFWEQEYEEVRKKPVEYIHQSEKKAPKVEAPKEIVVNGSALDVQGFNATYVGQLEVGEETFVLVKGYACESCDAPLKLQVQKLDEEGKQFDFSKTGYTMPGKRFLEGEFVADTRAFYGQCLPGKKDVLLWTGYNLSANGKSTPLNDVFQFSTKGLAKQKVKSINLGQVLSRVKAGECTEIPPQDSDEN